MKRLVINKADLIENINKIKDHAKQKKVIAMVKGNGYGLGIKEFSCLLYENGIRDFSVCLPEEAIAVKEAVLEATVMLLTPVCDIEKAEELIKKGIVLTVSSDESASVLKVVSKKLDETIKYQLAVDTGFGRFGYLYTRPEDAAKAVLSLENCELVGTFSHFSDSFSKKDKNTKAQFNRFMAFVSDLNRRGIDTSLLHISNSSAILKYPQMHLDAVRTGSAFLGRIIGENSLNLNKIAHLESEIIETKTLPKGYNIGYANTYTTKRETKIAVVPVGYMDGFGVIKANDTFRFSDCVRYAVHDMLSVIKDKKVYVTVNGKKCPVLGRVSMFNVVIDITDITAYTGDKALFEINPILIDKTIKREYR